uniref:Uncharacterized protein n=1 Tax=Arundo donax TaxID=35708 RepID=A0A0A9AP05_ARUDO
MLKSIIIFTFEMLTSNMGIKVDLKYGNKISEKCQQLLLEGGLWWTEVSILANRRYGW